MKPIHLTGMGVTGSLVALMLRHQRIPFTWHDSNASVTAWRASTGGVFPSGSRSSMEMRGYHFWRAVADTRKLPQAILATAPYLYNSKAPPHGAPGFGTPLGSLNHYPEPSVHFNPQRLVEFTRALCEAGERDGPPTGTLNIVTHGFQGAQFGIEPSSYQWGWSQKVRVTFKHPSVYRSMLSDKFGSPTLPPALYLRQGRFIMAYLYPIPGEEGLWYFGSHMIAQKVPKPLTIVPKYEALRTWAFTLAGDALKGITPVGEPTEGWRPIAGAGWGPIHHERTDDGPFTMWVRKDGPSRLICRPMGSSGFRFAPMLLDSLAAHLKTDWLGWTGGPL